MVWLTGGALVLCTLMVLFLLGIVFWQGFSTFWPSPVVRMATPDGRVYMGEVTRQESYSPEQGALDQLAAAVQTSAEAERAAAGEDAKHWASRSLVRTGNFRLTQNHFSWVSSYEQETRESPPWAMTIERLEWGRFYGFPEAFAEIKPLPNGDGEVAQRAATLLASVRGDLPSGGEAKLAVRQGQELTLLPVTALDDPGSLNGELVGVAAVTQGPEVAWDAFRAHHDEVRDRWHMRRSLEEDDTGAVNHKQEKARLAMRGAEIKRDREAEGTPARARAEAAYQEAVQRYEAESVSAQKAFDEIRTEINKINDENSLYQLVMRTAGEGTSAPQMVLLRLDDIVRAYPANQVSFASKLGIYASRWREFLLDEPREANSEGGVFPAIFGTVAMTLIMSLAVVPFGVLTALYLREYAKAGPVVSAVRIAVNNLAGVPSIVFGVFGLGFFCYVVGASLDQILFAANLPNPTFGKGGLMWASLTLALLTLPVVIVATEEAVAAVPSSMREGSYACGASKWQTIKRIVLPRAMPGIITGMVLAIARGAGEVAPLMLVGAVKLAPELPIDGLFPFLHPERSFMHLGFHIYDVGFQSQNSEAAKPMVFTATLLLILIVSLLNVAAIGLRGRLRKRFAGSQF